MPAHGVKFLHSQETKTQWGRKRCSRKGNGWMLKAGSLLTGYCWGRGCWLSSSRFSWQSHLCRPNVQILTCWGCHWSVQACCFLSSNQKFWSKHLPCIGISSTWGAKPASPNSHFPKYCQHFLPLPRSHSHWAFWQPFEYILTCRVVGVFCVLNTTTKCWNLVWI